MGDNNSKNQYEYSLQNKNIVDDHGNKQKKQHHKETMAKKIHKKV